MENKKILFTIFVLGLIFVVGCGQSTTSSGSPSLGVPAPGSEDIPEMVVVEEGQKTEEPLKAEEVTPSREDTQQAGEVKEITMTAQRFSFNPGTITVNKGDTVKISIRSTDVTHGFTISEFGINVQLTPGKTEIIEFIADKTGTFRFYCSVPCGTGHGRMNGKLIVK